MVRHVPSVDVIVAKVLDVGQRGDEVAQARWIGREGGAFGEEKGWLGVDGTLEDDSTASLVYGVSVLGEAESGRIQANLD